MNDRTESERLAPGDAVKQRRQELDLTQSELAKLAGVSESTIRNIETHRIIRLRNVEGVEEVLGWAPGSYERVIRGEEPVVQVDTEAHRLALATGLREHKIQTIREARLGHTAVRAVNQWAHQRGGKQTSDRDRDRRLYQQLAAHINEVEEDPDLGLPLQVEDTLSRGQIIDYQIVGEDDEDDITFITLTVKTPTDRELSRWKRSLLAAVTRRLGEQLEEAVKTFRQGDADDAEGELVTGG